VLLQPDTGRIKLSEDRRRYAALAATFAEMVRASCPG
jgi:hypothetical protein